MNQAASGSALPCWKRDQHGAGSLDAAGGAATGQPGTRVEIVPGARLTGKVERHEQYGIFVYLAPGRSGLIRAAETGLEKGKDFKKAFPAGSEIEVIVLDIDPDGRRIGLSRKAVLEAGEKKEVNEYTAQQGRAGSEGFGSLADKMRAAMRPKKD